MVRRKKNNLILVFILILGLFACSAILERPALSTSVTASVVILKPSLLLSPASGPGGTLATVTGSQFPIHQLISLVISDAQNNLFTLGSATSNATGAFVTQVTIPNAVYPGGATIYAQQNGKSLAFTTFTVPFPTITLNPISAPDGTQVSVKGIGFAINQPVTIIIGTSITNNLIQLGLVSADGVGAFTTKVKIPTNTSTGNYIISARETVNTAVYGASFFTVVPANTVTVLLSSQNPAALGSLVTFTATVTPVAPATGIPTGTVTFVIDGKVQPAVALLGGKATISTSSLSIGSHTIFAKYSGDSNFITSTSSSILQTVKYSSITTLASNKNPSLFGKTVTFTANVSGASSGKVTPTGTVTFVIDGTAQPPVTLSKQGTASFSTSTLSKGSHTISAKYSGNSNFMPSVAALIQQVN